MDAIEENALNPCHTLVQAIPKRQLWSKEEMLGREKDQLIFRYRGIIPYTDKIVDLEWERYLGPALNPLPPLLKGPIS